MASFSSWNPFAFKTLPSPTSIKPHRHLASPATVSASSFPSKKIPTLKTELKPSSFVPRAAVDDDEWGKGKEEGDPEAGGVAVAEPAEEEVVVSEVGELKKKLKELLYGTDRGLKASSETRAEIVELITQLEAKNPTPAPTEALALLNGKWILA